jgi:hypothetical protein
MQWLLPLAPLPLRWRLRQALALKQAQLLPLRPRLQPRAARRPPPPQVPVLLLLRQLLQAHLRRLRLLPEMLPRMRRHTGRRRLLQWHQGPRPLLQFLLDLH